ncbi:MAG: NAD-dependent epimerase/dehydratase family protein, partial [Nevskia sp.]|nr:NAD-dependent epimerase/dehydratase family protein [Nevskia sp.]
MKAFVTGGSGFVGRNLLAALLARGDSVVALARSLAAMQTVRALGAEPLAGDLVDVAAMSAGMRGADVVFHCAAKVEDWGDPAEFRRVNVEGTANVIAAARAAGVRRLVHISTEAVLADGTPIRN